MTSIYMTYIYIWVCVLRYHNKKILTLIMLFRKTISFFFFLKSFGTQENQFTQNFSFKIFYYENIIKKIGVPKKIVTSSNANGVFNS